MNQIIRQKSLIGIVASVIVMLAVALFYFYPDVFEGNVLRQHDTQQGIAISHEINQWHDATGEQSMWTNSLFGGMPAFQIAPSYTSGKLINFVAGLYRLWLPGPAGLVMSMMLGFFILLMALKVRWSLALPGAIAYGLSSYFIIIIGAGHIWKFITLSYMAPTVAGIVLAYRGRYLAGGAVAALFAMLQIAGNHIQMSYYFLLVELGFVIAAAIQLGREHKWKRWCKGTCALAVAAILAVAANAPNLYNTYEYSKETMRGRHSELSSGTSSSSVGNSGGLSKEYITAWSYGKDETMTLLIPNVKGGATIKPEKGGNKLLSLAATDAADNMAKKGVINSDIRGYLGQLPQYFGDQPMTNGPVYVGALMVALFLLGCFVVKGPIKWMLVIVTVLSIALSWGHNMMWLTDWMIDHMPMYNKFRTVASILVVAEFTIPLLGILALSRVLTDLDNWRNYRKAFAISFGIPLVICLAGILVPSVFGSYLSADEQNAYVASGVIDQIPQLFAAVQNVRMAMVSSDALRSFVILAIGAGLLVLVARRMIRRITFCALLTVLVIIDMGGVDKRYLDSESFVPAASATQPFVPTTADRQILTDTTMNYRVMDIPRFGEAAPSYFHKTIGGYHAAKLTRYQDLIDRHLSHFVGGEPSDADMNVLNMLNAKYLVMGEDKVYVNPEALGNAWLVDRIEYVDGADAEMDALSIIDPAITAVSDMRFRDVLGTSVPAKEPGDTIYETTYAPNRLTYDVTSRNGGVAVFSEVYFPWGWTATIDGKDAEIARVDYVLRALRIPAGQHKIVMTFDPKSTHTATTIAIVAIVLIYLIVAAAIVITVIARKKRN